MWPLLLTKPNNPQMQLKKQKIRRQPTFHAEKVPHGIKRNASDFNQKNNKEQRTRNAHGDTF